MVAFVWREENGLDKMTSDLDPSSNNNEYYRNDSKAI
jgi:hypothetical protein